MRILNKFYFLILEKNVDQFAEFIKMQILNLRSNNSRNSMALFAELFKENSEHCLEGRKVNDNWVTLVEANLQTMLSKTVADK